VQVSPLTHLHRASGQDRRGRGIPGLSYG
jgi:hypothetical protein